MSNLNKERAAELKNIHQRPGVRCFVVDQFFSPFTLTKGGGVTERWHDDKWGWGGLSIHPNSDDVIYEQPLTRKREVDKSIQRCGIDRLAEGYKRVIDEIKGPTAKRGFSGRSPIFWAQKKRSLLDRNHVLAMTGQSCAKKKVPVSQINISLLANFGRFFGKADFRPENRFWQDVKTAILPKSGRDRIGC